LYLTEDWDLSPSSIIWNHDDTLLYLLVQEHGRVKLFEVALRTSLTPRPLISEHSLSAVFRAGTDLFITQSSLIEPQIVQIYDTGLRALHPLFRLSPATPLTANSVQEFWFEGFQGQDVHGFLHLPESFDETKKYPLALLIHGGPQGAWEDAWSLRWNSAVFANAGDGWVIALINPTGSTGYGQKFQDAVRGNWATKPCTPLLVFF